MILIFLIFKVPKVFNLNLNIAHSHIKIPIVRVRRGYLSIPKTPYDQEAISPDIPNPIRIENEKNVTKSKEKVLLFFCEISKDIGPPRNTKIIMINTERPIIVSN